MSNELKSQSGLPATSVAVEESALLKGPRLTLGGARNPQDLPKLYARLFNAGDLDALCDLYAPNAVMAMGSEAPARRANLRQALALSIARGVPITVTNRRVLMAGDTAQLLTDWWLQGLDANGQPVAESGRAVDVVQRGPDGCFRYLIDNPAGARL
jgi:ketosteroid isomerase-like protein